MFVVMVCKLNTMERPSFGQRLKLFREASGKSQRQLAREAGLTNGTISQAENDKLWIGQAPSTDIVRRLAKALDVTADELWPDLEETQYPPPPPRRPLTDDELFDKIGAGYVEDIPFIEDVLASAGPGSGIPQDIDDTLPKARKRRYFKHLRSLLVTGRCLEPDLCPGDLVHIDRDREPVAGKFVVAVRDEEEAIIKRLVERDGVLHLAANDGRPVIPVDERIRILGPVVAYQRGLW